MSLYFLYQVHAFAGFSICENSVYIMNKSGTRHIKTS